MTDRAVQRTNRLYPSYFKLQVCWLLSFTPVTDLCKFPGVIRLPPSCNSNYFGYVCFSTDDMHEIEPAASAHSLNAFLNRMKSVSQ
ncbi:hypothetical protein Dda3937_04511 [Dickeya dadantii 3937]|uniref:Uncharacterized protein n=1 Tax=Dickeya dadantii (strain 3937) TaxID=198628 RepID=E0SGM7_DICD3|nr:hypothetical protein Dda3937_04511 [Dickeya dadantii 3937]